ncbi:hypothetical protein FOZ63_031731 [Perkinsus olseni]|uniref:Cullin N-terminal domain-containing protein n=1 Tax=Perkinsus olseni TaxID=32597 RepID=A0A7J6NYE3_PEROL|nr:hypothetical protein FOZ63_031731 [Perkinsus olseni]
MSAYGETVPLDEGWTLIREKAIDKLEYYLDTGEVPKDVVQVEGKPPRIFGAGDYAQLYTTVYNMCTQRSPNNWSEELYQRYGESMSSYVTRKVVPRIEGLEGEALLRELLLRWNNHKLYSKWMERFFTYLDRYYVKLQSVDTLAVRGVTIFKNLAFDHGHVAARCRAAILDMINREREGNEIDQGLLRGVVDMLFDLGNASRSNSPADAQGTSSSSANASTNRPTLGAAPSQANDELSTLWVYQQELVEYLLPETARFYERQAKVWLVNDSLPEYLIKTESALMAEQRRVESYLHPSSMQKIKDVVIKATLTNTMSQTLEKDTNITWMLDNDRREDLSRLWRMFGLVNNGLTPIAASFKQYVQDLGNSVVDALLEQLRALGPQPSPQAKAEILSDPTFVQKLIDMHDR